MGAIAGVHAASDAIRRVRAMAEAAPHRGRHVEVVSLDSSALAVIRDGELDDTAIGVDDDLAVAFVGTIDNRAQLESDLKTAPGRRSRGGDASADPLVRLLAAGYRAFGHELPARLRGMFAAIITDGATACCFRDQLGYKPLFYRLDGHGFFAGSEAKQVVAGAQIPREPDVDVVELIFYRSLNDDTAAALKGVERLPKMTSLIVEHDAVRRRRYWHPERLLETGTFTEREIQERFDTLMDVAVSRTLTGHDALSLSGGIDSPAILAYAAPRHRQIGAQPLTGLTAVFPKYPSVDESRYVKLLADRFDIPLHLYEQRTNPLADFERWTALADTPYASASLAQYEEDYLKARSLGFRNLLTGEHAEFLMAIGWYTLDHYLSHGRFRSAWREISARRAAGRSWFALARLAGRAVAPGRTIKAVDRIMKRRSPLVPDWIDQRMATEETPVPVRDRWRTSQLGAFIGPGTSLEAEEICQAVCGIVVRRPWTDVDLWEFFLSLPAEQKFPARQSKALVRRLLRGRVPNEILDRTDKTVFDEAAKAQLDYATLERHLAGSAPVVRGVDYDALAELIGSRRLSMLDYQWARNLANIHAFMAQWR
jgi:asparagine synthetase B (glutamine-hydrolysing)